MRRYKWIAAAGLILALALGFAVTASGADSFKVTFSGGLYGDADTPSVMVPAGGSIDPDDYAVTVKNSKYTFIGFHIAGQEPVVHGSTRITHDTTFVAAYGVKGSLVSYTIHYVDAKTGKALHAPRTYYGNIGDKPVSAYIYIEKYRPEGLAITGTLKAGTNDWTLQYYPNPEPTASPTPTPAPRTWPSPTLKPAGSQGADANANTGAPASAASTSDVAASAASTSGATASAESASGVEAEAARPAGDGGNAAAGPESAPANAEPAELIDMDERDNGQTGTNAAGDVGAASGHTVRKNTWPAVAAGAAGLAGLLLFLWYVLLGRKENRKK